MEPDLVRAYQREWRKAKRKGLPTKGILERLREEGFAPAYSKVCKTNDFEREYARRMSNARYHGRPTEGIRRELRREYELAGKPIPSTPRKSKHSTVPKEVDTTMSDEEFAAHVHSALMKYRKDMKELAARRKQQEREELERAEQRRQEKEAERMREWAEYIKGKQCRTCFNEQVTYAEFVDEKGFRRREAKAASCRLHPERSIRQTSPACSDYDDMYRNAIIDL